MHTYIVYHTQILEQASMNTIELYKNNLSQVIHEYPFHIAYKHERAVDTGRVSRDLSSAFCEVAYVTDFDGGITCIPSVHPHADRVPY